MSVQLIYLLSFLFMLHSLTQEQIAEKERSAKWYRENPPAWTLPIQRTQYTDEDREQFEYDRFVFLNDERQTAF